MHRVRNCSQSFWPGHRILISIIGKVSWVPWQEVVHKMTKLVQLGSMVVFDFLLGKCSVCKVVEAGPKHEVSTLELLFSLGLQPAAVVEHDRLHCREPTNAPSPPPERSSCGALKIGDCLQFGIELPFICHGKMFMPKRAWLKMFMPRCCPARSAVLTCCSNALTQKIM